MAPLKGQKSALQRLAEEGSKGATDFDPEDFGNGPASNSDSDGSDVSEAEAKSHYQNVGTSKLRKTRSAELGPQYAGSQVSRNALDQYDEDDEKEDDEEDEEINAGLYGYGSGSEQDLGGLNDEGTSEDDDDEDDDNEDDDEGFDDEDEDYSSDDGAAKKASKASGENAALLSMAAQGQGAVVQNLAQAAQADVEKGNAVKKQRKAFNALLNTRMRLQKGLIAANSLSTVSSEEIASASDREVIESAEKAALSLFNSISSMRASLSDADSTESRGTKRPFNATLETPTTDIHSHIRSLESSNTSSRKATLTRWSQKTQPSTGSKSRDATNQQSLVSVLESQLTSGDLTRLISRTRIPRSCAPIQAETNKSEDPSIYDDADWYALLLRDLVEAKMGETGGENVPGRGMNGTTMPTAASVDALRRQAKSHRANVDVKASKGRKLKFTVQEKLQNFMAPEDRTAWGERQITELFGSLLGKRIAGGLGEAEDEDDYDAEEPEQENGFADDIGKGAEPLRLFS